MQLPMGAPAQRYQISCNAFLSWARLILGPARAAGMAGSARSRSGIGCQRAGEAIAKAVIGADGRQRPVGVAPIERKIGKLLELETACGISTTHDAARRLVSKVGHHGHAAAIATQRIVHST